jgi:predicted acetyltransferase
MVKYYLLFRLSAIAGAKLTDGNANIADLSDDNRPTKLAEQFSELYDNEWTDAFGYLTRDDTLKEEESCTILLNILCVSDELPLI